MVHLQQIERALADALADATGSAAPSGLAGAIRHAVFPGGARVRPRLCLAVAAALDPGAVPRALPPAVAVELLHCASLAHDDLPCFDDAALRRGRPSVHRAWGAPLAVLAGDALIVAAFEWLALAGAPASATVLVARAAGSPHGLVAGQAWENEADAVSLRTYQHAKTANLFAAAAEAGALVAGADAPASWRAFGLALGEAYQIADDIRDAVGCERTLGKPAGRDHALDRPSAARQDGVAGARARLEQLMAAASATIPPCPGAGRLRAAIRLELARLLPKDLGALAA